MDRREREVGEGARILTTQENLSRKRSDKSDGLDPTVADAEGPLREGERRSVALGRVVQEEDGRAGVWIAHDFEIGPGDLVTPDPGTERLGGSFFGGKTPGQRFDAILRGSDAGPSAARSALCQFGRRIDAAQKAFSMPVDGQTQALDLDQVYACAQRYRRMGEVVVR